MLGTQFATRVLSNLGRHQVSLSPAPCWGPGVLPGALQSAAPILPVTLGGTMAATTIDCTPLQGSQPCL